ncbi:MAG TPA: NRAMP family divalent metal transporter [Streptosporangiaceae bacterium]|nr:NRAMP family divalent metal transporter [Streptosporangiaceae bacterium]
MARFLVSGAPWARLAAAARLPQRAAVAELAATGTAVRDSAHLGDIRGAFGTVRADTLDRPATWGRRLRYLLAIMGPGLIVMVGDNDAGGMSTYAQAGQDYGTRLLWVLALLIPVLVVNQEMVVRLGAVTGVGHARLIHERFGRFWAAFSVGDLVLVNGLTIVTEFIGIALAGSYFGVPRWLSVAGAALVLVAFTVTGSFRRWERWMYALIAANVVMIPLVLVSHVQAVPVARGFLLPGLPGGLNAGVLLLIIAIVGTTVAPWQLFFQQSNVVDKRITPRWIGYERADTVIGSFVVVIGAAVLISVTAFGFAGSALHGHFTDAGATAAGLGRVLGQHAGGMFALLLLDASLLGAAAVTLATSYALGDIAGAKHSLHRSIKDAPLFYGAYAFFLAAAGTVVLIPGAPLGLITEGVQALAGVLLPSATVFLVLLCNDRAVLGPWVNKAWLNAIAGVIIGVLVLLSLVLTAATLFPGLSGGQLAALLGGGVGVGLLAAVGWAVARWLAGRRLPGDPEAELDTGVVLAAERMTWRMPPLAELPRPAWSPGRKLGMITLRLYLVIAVSLVIVKIIQLSLAH